MRVSSKFLQSPWMRYGAAVLLIALSAALCWALRHAVSHEITFMIFLPAVLAAAWLGGIGPALLVFIAGALLGDRFILAEPGSRLDHGPTELSILLAYAISSAISILLVACLRAQRQRAELASLQVQDHARRLELEAAQRSRAEDAAGRYYLLAEHSRDIILFVRPDDGRILEANSAALDAYGYSRDELLALNVFDLRAPDQRATVRAQMDQADASSILFETVHQRKDGSTFPVEVNSRGTTMAGQRILLSIVRDITRRKIVERLLGESRQMLQLVLDNIPARVFWKDRDSRYLGCNRALAADAGLDSPDQIVGKTDSDLPWRAHAELYRNDDRQIIQSGQARLNYEEPYECDGQRRWLHTSKVPLRDAAGQIIGVLGTFEDITDRKLAEAALLHAKQQWERTYDSVPDLIAILDNNHRILRANRAMAQHLGLTPEQCVGHICHKLVHGLDAPPPFCPHSKALADGHEHACELHEPRVDGHFLVSATPLHDEHGRVVGSVHVARDITSRRRAEQAVRQTNQLLEAILNHTHMLVACFDRDFNFVLANAAYASADGKTPDFFPGKNHFELFPNPENEAIFRQVRDSGRPFFVRAKPFEYAHNPERGVSYWDWSLIPIPDASGKVQLLVMTLADVTPIKRTEDDLRHAKEQAEAANAAKDRFIAVLSHELRTPLTPALAAASALAHDQSLPDTIREDLATIARNVALEARLIDDLLEITHIASGKLLLRLERADAADILREVIRICGPEALGKRLRLAVDLPHAPCPMLADVTRLHQVFWNLLKNAIKFTPSDGTIRIAAARDTRDDDQWLTVSVADSGIGIEPDMLPRLFRPFEQGQRVISDTFGGLGLGLSIAKAVVEMHGGRIHAASPGPNHGATFTVELPLLCDQATQQPADDGERPADFPSSPRASPAPSLPLRILLVEDHADTARLIEKLLACDGHHVTTAASVASALIAARDTTFDVMLCDLGLPDGSGHDLIRTLRAAGVAFPAIAVSGYGSPADQAHSLAAGFAEHLTKPIDFPALQAALARSTSPPTANSQPATSHLPPTT